MTFLQRAKSFDGIQSIDFSTVNKDELKMMMLERGCGYRTKKANHVVNQSMTTA